MGREGRGVGSVFIVAEVALAAVLLVGAGLLIQTFLRWIRWTSDSIRAISSRCNSRCRLQSILAFAAPHSMNKHWNASARMALSFPRRCRNDPLGDSLTGTGFSIEGREPVVTGRLNPVTRINVSAGYLQTMEIQILRGRDFASADRAGSTPVAIINEELARRYFPGEESLGRRLKFGRPNLESPVVHPLSGSAVMFAVLRFSRRSILKSMFHTATPRRLTLTS